MKNLWLPALLASAIIVSCGKDPQQGSGDGTGGLVITPAVNSNVTDVVTRANIPVTDFTGYVLTLDGPSIEQMECPADGKVEGLDPGDYMVGLTNLNDDFVPAFDSPRYGGTKTAAVRAGEQTPVAIVLTQANAGVKFLYDASLAHAGLGGLTATVSQMGNGLIYSDENRNSTGHFLPGEVVLTLENGGETVTIGGHASKKYTLAAKELWTITLKVAAVSGGLTVSAEIDVTVTDRTDEVGVDPGGGSGEKSRATIDAFAGQTVAVTFTDETTLSVKFDASGQADIRGNAGQVIKTLRTEEGDEIPVGRRVGEPFTLKIEDGDVVFRDADGQGRIPLGTRAELDLLNNSKEPAILSGNYLQEGDIDLLFLDGDNIITSVYYWYGIGVEKDNYFTGTYDGGGYKLYNMGSRGSGLFGYANNATIKNVTLASGFIEGYDYVGGICGYANGTTRIEGCTNYARISAARSSGGIVGEIVSGSSSYVVVSGCRNYGEISASYTAVGGIAGFNGATGEGAVIEKSVNHGKVYAGGGWVGGIVGNCSGTVSQCINHGAVHANGTSNGMAGGICGRGYSVRITASYNTGDITSAKGAGGIIGTFYKTSTGQSTYLSACYNTGKVTAESGNAGAIAGTQEDANSAIEACYWTAVNGSATQAVGAVAEAAVVETVLFSASAWPEHSHLNWGTTHWKHLGGWNGGSPVYPVLIWE